MSGGKGSSAPDPPDYAGAAQATAAGNLEAARAATRANRVNQYTPYGSSTWGKTNEGQVNWGAYNAAVDAWKNNQSRADGLTLPQNIRQAILSDPSVAAQFPKETVALVRQAANPGPAPNINDFISSDPDSGWYQTVNLTPEAQATLDAQMRTSRAYGETAEKGFDAIKGLFESPQLDMSQLPARAIDVGKTAQDAIMSRLQPQLAQQDEVLRARLANQGIMLGSEAYGKEMGLQGQKSNDLLLQAALQGINLDQTNRTNALQEMAYLQDRPLNLINALRTGAQVQNPTFQSVPQQQTTAGPNILGATQAQYGDALNAYNASQAQSGSMLSGLFGIGSGIMGLPVKGGGSVGASLFGF